MRPPRHAGSDLEAVLSRLGVLDDIIIQAAEGRLTATSFAQAWRKRRGDPAYLKQLLHAVEATGRKSRVIALCEYAAGKLRIARFRKRLLELTGANSPTQS